MRRGEADWQTLECLKTSGCVPVLVRYAQAPVGELRWAAPVGVQHPRGTVIDASGPFTAGAGTARACMQPVQPASTNVYSAHPGYSNTAEDCLYLNVWSTANVSGSDSGSATPAPVMVWLHPGGLSSGSGADFDPSALLATATANGTALVVVTLNYRLGGRLPPHRAAPAASSTAAA